MELSFKKCLLAVLLAQCVWPSADGGLLDAINVLGNGVNSELTNHPLVGIASTNLNIRAGEGNTGHGLLGANNRGTFTNTNRPPQPQAYPQQFQQQYQNQAQQRYPPQQRYPAQTFQNQGAQTQPRPQTNKQNLQTSVDTAQKLLERLQELNRIKDQQRNQTSMNQANGGDYSSNQNSGSNTNQGTNYPSNPNNNYGQQNTNQGTEGNYPNNGNKATNQINWNRPITNGQDNGYLDNNSRPNTNTQGNTEAISTHAEETKPVTKVKKLRLKKFFYQAKPVLPENEVNSADFTLFYYD